MSSSFGLCCAWIHIANNQAHQKPVIPYALLEPEFQWSLGKQTFMESHESRYVCYTQQTLITADLHAYELMGKSCTRLTQCSAHRRLQCRHTVK
ncbi:hypothetical protein DM02DRAFT_614153 [Periconia macrospinosa]|uniref:Uncharacterized protein n=1 Tax=Periconia macrospinosa TaxID=97972 RepID=A0A2V1DRA4_9PLEO|nr:hypothetical protein DM02DRAFT_614153 [Periconia macrospinosa]